MAGQLTLTFAFGLMFVLLASVFGAVDERERAVFCLGVLGIIVGPSLGIFLVGYEMVGGFVATLGFLAVIASTIPLLR